jgi:ketosteroid isomerase-like protein
MADSVQTFLDEWTAAERSGDTESLQLLLTEDFAGVGPLGFILPKQAWLARYRQGDLTYDSFGLAEIQTRILGDAAIVTARNNVQGSYQDHPVPEASRVTLVLARNVGYWRLAAAHMSFVAGTRGAPPLPGPSKQGDAA